MPVAVLRADRRTMNDKVDECLQCYEAGKAQRSTWDFDYQDIVRYLAPGCDDILELHSPGQSRMEHIYDSHPLRAPHILAANMLGAITNQSMMWRHLRFRNRGLNESQEVNGWLQAYDDDVMSDYASSGFYQQAYTYYYILANFGTAALYFNGRAERDGLHLYFKTLSTGSYVIMENVEGLVNTLVREVWWTPRQAVEKFGEKCSDEIRKKADSPRDCHTYQKFLHGVYPRKGYDAEKISNTNMPFAELHIEYDTKHLCDESGYWEFPYMVSRNETMGRAPYGFGLGHIALPDVRVLNKLRELNMQQLAAWIQPPLQVLQESVIGHVSLDNYAMNVVRQADAIKPISLEGRPDLVQISAEDLRRSIDDTYMVNALQALPPPDASNMTAYEVSQRLELMTRTMGPVFYRLLAEFLNPLEDRMFGIRWRAGVLPPLPREVMLAAQQNQGQLDVDYDGPLARAQRGDEVQAFTLVMNDAQRIIEMTQKLDVLDNLYVDEGFRHAAEVRGYPKAYIRDMRDVVKMRIVREQQQAQLQQAQMRNESMAAMGRVAPMVQAMQGGTQRQAA